MRPANSEKENKIREKLIAELYGNEYNQFIGQEKPSLARGLCCLDYSVIKLQFLHLIIKFR